MSDTQNDTLLLEREYNEERIDNVVAAMRSLQAHPGYKLLQRELKIKARLATDALVDVDPDKPGKTGKLQGTVFSYNEIANFADDVIDVLNEKREELKQARLPIAAA